MITAGFKNLMKQVLSSGGTSQGLLPIKDVGGTTRYLADYTAYPYTVSTTFTLTASDAGISVGTGNTASSENDYQLASTITSGLTGSVLVSKSVDSNDNSSIVLFVTLTNTTGSDISISEIGYKQECSASDAQDGTTTTNRVFLVDRTVLATPITIPANGQGIIRYTLTTKYGSAGGVEDVLVNGTSVVTAGIARVTVPTVEANPSGTPTADLTKLQIGNGIYGITNVSANVAVSTLATPLTTLKINDDEYTVPSGGGTTVVANPSGTATDDLEKIQIGNTIYDIPSGGGASVYMSDYYDTEERIVGRYIDGKPLYQKTFDFSSSPKSITAGAWTTLVSNLSSILGSVEHIFGNSGQRSSDRSDVIYCLRVNNDNLEAYSYSLNITDLCYLTVQYTKTTDAPGTGPTAGNIIYLPALYSEEEREVGVDEDGYPVYQKTIPLGTLTRDSSWHSVAHGISNFSKLKKMSGTVMGTDNNRFYEIPIYRSGNNEGITVGVDATNVYYTNNWISTTANASLTIQYTKTTDTAGSGTWTPDGQLAHHYSTSEHIVGTWIDGSTLYERTWDFGSDVSLTANNWYDTSISNSGISLLTNVEAISANGNFRGQIEGSVNSSGSYIQLRSDGIASSVRYVTLQYTKA